jgi:hypothetical protein
MRSEAEVRAARLAHYLNPGTDSSSGYTAIGLPHPLFTRKRPSGHITERVQRRFEQFVDELRERSVRAEWRVPADVARELHTRVIFDDEAVWELPALNSLLAGTVDSIRQSGMPRAPFEEAWESPDAQPCDAVQAPS